MLFRKQVEREAVMDVEGKSFPKKRIALATGLAWLALSGCNVGPLGKGQESGAKLSASEAKQDDFDLGSAALCVQTMAQNPTQAFHFSSSRTRTDTGARYSTEAQISPRMIDLTKSDSSSTTTTHWPRSDETGWAMAIKSIAMAGPWMQLKMAKFATKRAGPELVNSFESTKYDVDTTNDDPTDKAGYLAGMEARDYNIVGSAWLSKDTGCILKYDLDFEVDAKDGKVTKTHFEGAVTKK
jgi:hypothetical protein